VIVLKRLKYVCPAEQRTYRVASEIVASAAQPCELRALPVRVPGADVPTPFSAPLERSSLDVDRFADAIRSVISSGSIVAALAGRGATR
jgi:hypothetical protein